MLNFTALIANEEDQKYVENVFEQNLDRLYKIAFHHLHNHYDSEDCVNDVVLVLISKLQDFQTMNEMHQKNFLVKVCRCTAINKYKQNMRRNKYESAMINNDDFDIADVEDEDENIVDAVIAQESRQQLIDLIEELDPKYGDILYLKYILDMRNMDIAKYLNLTSNYVNVCVSRGLAKLKKGYGDKINEICRR